MTIQKENQRLPIILMGYNEYDEDADVGIIPAITSLFLDDELDPFELDFVEDAIEINTKDYTHISLSENHLLFLLQFYRYAKKIDDKCFNMTKSQAKLFK